MAPRFLRLQLPASLGKPRDELCSPLRSPEGQGSERGWGAEDSSENASNSDLLVLPFRVALCILILVTGVWGAQHAVIKAALASTDGLDAACLNFLRFAIAAVCFSPWLPRKLGGLGAATMTSRESSPRQEGYHATRHGLEWRGGVELGILQFLGFGFQALGLLYTTAQRSCLLLYLNVKLVPFLARCLLRQKVPVSAWLSAALALVGTGLLLSGAAYTPVQPNRGDALSIAAAVTSALFILRLERYAPHTGCESLTAVCMVVVTVFCALWILCVTFFSIGAEGIYGAIGVVAARASKLLLERPMSVFYLGVVSTAITSWLQTIAQRSVPATLASVIYALDPLWGCCFAWAMLGEQIGLLGLAGAACLLIAVVGQLVVKALADAHDPSVVGPTGEATVE